MARAKIQFKKLIQDSQTYESHQQNDDHMVSQAFFDLEINGSAYSDMHVEISQPFGTKFESEPIEVGPPIGSYKGPWNHAEFAGYCERYYRAIVGSKGKSIHIEDSTNVRMKNLTHGFSSQPFFIDVPSEKVTAGW